MKLTEKPEKEVEKVIYESIKKADIDIIAVNYYPNKNSIKLLLRDGDEIAKLADTSIEVNGETLKANRQDKLLLPPNTIVLKAPPKFNSEKNYLAIVQRYQNIKFTKISDDCCYFAPNTFAESAKIIGNPGKEVMNHGFEIRWFGLGPEDKNYTTKQTIEKGANLVVKNQHKMQSSVDQIGSILSSQQETINLLSKSFRSIEDKMAKERQFNKKLLYISHKLRDSTITATERTKLEKLRNELEYNYIFEGMENIAITTNHNELELGISPMEEANQ